jgi:hypothetical protein
MKFQFVAGLAQLIHKDVTRRRALQQRQTPVTTEGDEVQMALAVVALQSSRHRQPQERKS